MNITERTLPLFDCDEVEKKFGFSYSRMLDAFGVDSDTYMIIYCNDADLETLYMDLDYFINHNYPAKVEFTKNQIQVVEYLRSLGYRSEVLMYVHD